MKEIVVISGKGGTGKTSLTASFAVLSKNAVIADCDVDAADLHLVLSPEIRKREEFRCGREAVIRGNDCTGCGKCLEACRFDAVINQNNSVFMIDSTSCEGCGVCVEICPAKAIDFPERVNGEWYISDTRCGPMVHACLQPGGENSGKLVSKVREAAREVAEKEKRDMVIVDGPPGTGCAVIASLTGASGVLIVTEPTLSGVHDLRRILQLTKHFEIDSSVCVNKWDLNPEITEQIESEVSGQGVGFAGRVRYDNSITAAQIRKMAVVELDESPAGKDIRAVWEKLGYKQDKRFRL